MKITEPMLDSAMACIVPGLAVDRHDMRRAIEAAVSDDRALELLGKCVRLLSVGVIKDEIVAFLKERGI